MKNVGLLLFLGLSLSLFACGPKKGSVEKEQDPMEVVPVMNNPEYIQGTVTTGYAADDCKFLIQVQGKGGEQLINPVNLPDKYKENGAKIDFMWTASKAPQKDNCNIGIWAHITVRE